MSKTEIAITAFFAFISAWVGVAAIPCIILLVCNIADYGSRLVVNKITGVQIKSSVGIKGIFKKFGLWLLVFVGFMIDCMVTYTSFSVDFKLPFHFFFTCAVASWLVFNELISILENLADGGVNVPKFLLNIPRSLKSNIESTADTKGSENHDS